MNKEQPTLNEDTEVVIDAPYNAPLKHFFRDDNIQVQIFKENGGPTVIRIRYKDEKKE